MVTWALFLMNNIHISFILRSSILSNHATLKILYHPYNLEQTKTLWFSIETYIFNDYSLQTSFFTQIHILLFLSNNLSTVVPGAGREGGVSELRGHTFASQFECHTVTTHKNSPTFKPYHFTPTILCKKTHTTHLTSRCWLLVNHGDQVRNFKSPQVSRFPITSCRKIKRFL